MRRNLPWFLLAASVALNVFFLAGVFFPHYAWHGHGPDRGRHMAQVVEDFGLSERQARALEDLRERIAAHRRDRGGDRGAFLAVILDALRAPSFDRAALARSLEQLRSDTMGDMVLDMTQDLHGFLAELTPEQKTAFLARVEEDRNFLRRLLFPPRRPD